MSVSTAGDVNGDGYSDVIVGAPRSSSTGRAYIFYGGSIMDNVADVTMTGEVVATNYYALSVSTAGDINGDGYSDVIVGSPDYLTYTGRAYIFYGGVLMDNIADLTMTGEAIYNQFGVSVSTAGDVNGDGYSDAIVGANGYDGRAYIFYGSSSMNNVADVIITGGITNNSLGQSVSTAGDVNGDGYSDVIVGANSNTGRAYIYYGGSSMNNVPDINMDGETPASNFGYSVSTAGDVNGDGYSDAIVGSFVRAYIFYGGVSMNNVADVIMTGEGGGGFGQSVSTAGDINRDGYSDVIVGAPGYNSTTGRAYIFYGSSSMNNVADVIMTGEAAGNLFGQSVSTAGDVNGDGYSEVIVGAYGYGSYTGRAYLYISPMPTPVLVNPINSSINNPLTINFKWNKLNTTMYYVLYVSTDSSFNNIVVNDTIFIDTSRTVSELLKDTKYYWKVSVKDTSGVTNISLVWSFKTIPAIKVNLKILMEGMYSPIFNQLTRKDSITSYLRNAAPPYELMDSVKNSIDTISFSNLFKFSNSDAGTYYVVAKHFNSIETWSKPGGENLAPNTTIYSYDFTSSITQAYGNNLKLKGSKYCLFSGDINQDGFIDLFDVVPVYNDATSFVSGSYLATDLTGDGIVDLADVTLCYNNSINFIRVRRA